MGEDIGETNQLARAFPFPLCNESLISTLLDHLLGICI